MLSSSTAQTRFGGKTPDEEMSEDEITGIIDVGDDQDTIYKIISLTHEIGHAIHDRDKHFKNTKETMFSESIAWFFWDTNGVLTEDSLLTWTNTNK